MIQRHMKRPTEADFQTFDYFNDGQDTIRWLTGVIQSSTSPAEIQHLQIIRDRLTEGFDTFCKNFLKTKAENLNQRRES